MLAQTCYKKSPVGTLNGGVHISPDSRLGLKPVSPDCVPSILLGAFSFSRCRCIIGGNESIYKLQLHITVIMQNSWR